MRATSCVPFPDLLLGHWGWVLGRLCVEERLRLIQEKRKLEEMQNSSARVPVLEEELQCCRARVATLERDRDEVPRMTALGGRTLLLATWNFPPTCLFVC